MLPDSSEENAMPKFLLDENIPRSIKRFLESKGFSAEYSSKGIVNGKLASLAKEMKLVLVSLDSDFLDKPIFPPKEFSGIIVFVIHPPKPQRLERALSSLLSKVKEFKSKLFIVDEENFEVVD